MRIPITSEQLIFADNVCDYIIIPGVSFTSNLSVIFQKCLIHCFPKLVRRYHWFQHIKDKSLMRCVVLLVPILGSIAVAIHDYKNKSKKTNSEERPSSLLALPVEQRLELYDFCHDESLIDLAQTCRTIYSEVIYEKSLNKKMMLKHAFNMAYQIPYSFFEGYSRQFSALSKIMKTQLLHEDVVEAAKTLQILGSEYSNKELRAIQIYKDILKNIPPTVSEMNYLVHIARNFALNGNTEDAKKIIEILSKNNYCSYLKEEVDRNRNDVWSPKTTFITCLVILENYVEIEELIDSDVDVLRNLFFTQELLFGLAERGKVEQIKKFTDKIKFGKGDPRKSEFIFIRSLSYIRACCSTHSTPDHSIPDDFDAHIELILKHRDDLLNPSYRLDEKMVLFLFDIAYFLIKIDKKTLGLELINWIPKEFFFKDEKFLTSLYKHQLAANQKAAAEETVKIIKDKNNDFFYEYDNLRHLISLVLTKAKYQYFDECRQDLKDIQEIYRTGLLKGEICTKVMVLIAQAYTKINLTDDELKETLNDLKEISKKGIKDPFALCEVLSDIATLQNIHVSKDVAVETLCEARQISIKINNKHEKAKAFALFAYAIK